MLATAKIHILKQFTTVWCLQCWIFILCLLLQRYTFWSNSQRWIFWIYSKVYCACYCKDTHFEAIHNQQAIQKLLNSIVLATAKIHILKQFTTDYPSCYRYVRLCLLLQRYTFWSNSQQGICSSFCLDYCACYCKDTHFEAIHNPKGEGITSP